MIKYQGESVDFGLSVEAKNPTDLQSWEGINNVTIYLYTNSSYIVKYKYPETSGYKPLSMSNDKKTIVGVLDAQETSKMLGQLYIEILVEDHTAIEKYNTGIVIQPTNIKNEI